MSFMRRSVHSQCFVHSFLLRLTHYRPSMHPIRSAVISNFIILPQLYKPTTAVKNLEYNKATLGAFAMGARAPWLATPMSPSATEDRSPFWMIKTWRLAIVPFLLNVRKLYKCSSFRNLKAKLPKSNCPAVHQFFSAHAFNQKISCRRYASRAQQVEASQLSFTVSWCSIIAPTECVLKIRFQACSIWLILI